MTPVVGIDLGTSNSAVAAFYEGKHQVLADEQGNRLTPSVVSFGTDNKLLVGVDAKAQLFSNPKRTVASVKRLIGRKIFSPEVAKAKVLLPYELIEAEDQNVTIEIEGNRYTPQDISALILKHMKAIADHVLAADIKEAVVTVPAYFNDNQRQATKDACKIAGLEVLRFINEPTAAALAYGFGKGLEETVAIYDLGGGTFDISVLRLKDKVFEVVATAGDTYLGGDDFDERIVDILAENFLKRTMIDLRTIPAAMPLLRSNAERAKRKLSYAEKTDIYIPGIVQQNGQPLDLQYALSRGEFEEVCKGLIQKTFTVCDEALRAAGLKVSDLDATILVGGPTKMSLIYEAVTSYFGKPPLRDHNPDEVVAIGASIQAQTLKGPAQQKKALLLDVTPLDLGIATVDGYTETIIEGNSPIPVSASRMFTTTKDFQDSVLIRIFQGKNRREEDSILLGEFEFSGFKKAKAGLASLEVFFSINTDGIVEVNAKDKETGATQSMKVRLNAAMDDKKLEQAVRQTGAHKVVKLKDEWKGASKIVLCLPTLGGLVYEEGYIRSFDPLAASFHLENDGKGAAKDIERAKVNWLISVEDFANIPRYIQAISEKPQTMHRQLKAPLYQFRMKDGSYLYGQADLPKVRDEGFWIEPYFPFDELPGKVFVFSAMVQESAPAH